MYENTQPNVLTDLQRTEKHWNVEEIRVVERKCDAKCSTNMKKTNKRETNLCVSVRVYDTDIIQLKFSWKIMFKVEYSHSDNDDFDDDEQDNDNKIERTLERSTMMIPLKFQKNYNSNRRCRVYMILLRAHVFFFNAFSLSLSRSFFCSRSENWIAQKIWHRVITKNVDALPLRSSSHLNLCCVNFIKLKSVRRFAIGKQLKKKGEKKRAFGWCVSV